MEEFHECHFCGTYVKDGLEIDGKRHWLSDCRPDLVEHEVGDKCTWAYKRGKRGLLLTDICYAYSTDGSHISFYKDGPM